MPAGMHREDVKAALRKRFGSIQQFERDRALPPKSVSDVLRGRTNERVSQAIQQALSSAPPPSDESDKSDETRRAVKTLRPKKSQV